MNVGELKKELKKLNPTDEIEIIISSDAEGNRHLPMSSVHTGMYDFENKELTPLNGNIVLVFYPI